MTTKAQDNETLVREVQKWLGVTVDGWAGPATLGAWIEKVGNGVRIVRALDKAKFFATVRKSFGELTKKQVEGFEAVLEALKSWDETWLAYGLATAWHETAFTMQPIKEYGGEAYFRRMYDIEGERPHKARELGNLTPGDGAKYAGRGYVQLTGRKNYARFGIADTPDDAMKPDVAARIMRDGMEKGIFTEKAMKDYLPGDYVGARRIINRTDKAEQIAGYAKKFEAAVRAAR